MVKCYFRANVLEVFKTIAKGKIMVHFYGYFVFGRKRYFAVVRISYVKLSDCHHNKPFASSEDSFEYFHFLIIWFIW